MTARGLHISKIGGAGSTNAPRVSGWPLLLTLLILFWMTAFSFQQGIGANSAPRGLVQPVYGRGYVDGVFYLLALAGALVHPNEMIRLAGRMRTYVAFVAFAALSAAWSIYPGWAMISAGHYAGVWLVAAITALSWCESRERLYVAINWVMIAYLLASLAVVVLDPAIGVRTIQDASGAFSGRWQGISSHPNDFAYSTILLIWSALAVREERGNVTLRRVNYVAIPLALVVAAFGARSMTATLADLAMIAAYFAFPSTRATPLAARRRIVLLTVFGVGVALAAVAIIVSMTSEGGGGQGAVRVGGRDLATMSGRTQLWEIGWWAFTRRPLAGWSFDDLATFFNFVGGGNFPFNQFHNGWMDLMVRGGAIGLVLGLAMMIRFIWITARLWRIDPTAARISGVYFVAVMLENLSEAQLAVAGNPLWVMLVVLWVMNEEQMVRARAPGAVPQPGHTHGSTPPSRALIRKRGFGGFDEADRSKLQER